MKKFTITIIGILIIFFAHGQCQADFSYLQVGSTIVFEDLSTIQSTNYSATWSWDFGDGNTSTQQNPIHNYSNGIYSACLIVTFFDSTIMNYCTSIYCDSILVGNIPPASWDCTPATGCYDPGTGNGQYTTLAACQSACTVTSSWDCNPPNMPAGCYDPGTGNGQYTTLAACQSACTVVATWDCGPFGCYDPGTGIGQYTTLSSCQSNCSGTTFNYCDSMMASGSQYQITMEVNNINIIIDYWITTAPDGTVLSEDSASNMHNVWNSNTLGIPYDTITTCITYTAVAGFYTCCVNWIWNSASGTWNKMSSITSIGEINSANKNLLKVVDVLGREISKNRNRTLFFIYDDGTVEKKIFRE